jgi:hypothetical protein
MRDRRLLTGCKLVVRVLSVKAKVKGVLNMQRLPTLDAAPHPLSVTFARFTLITAQYSPTFRKRYRHPPEEQHDP